MTRKEALEGLSSRSAHDRLKAARFLAREGSPSDLLLLREALSRETDSYVRNGLMLAIRRASKEASSSDGNISGEYEVPPDVLAQIRSQTTEEIAGQILHEIASPVGLIAAAAAREFPSYERSTTKQHVDALRRVFEAIAQLKSAAAVPRPEEFDLAELVREIVSEQVPDDKFEVSLVGTRPMLITSDRALLQLAISNGIRNAVEAVAVISGDEPHAIVVTWGETNIDYWVAILDRGPGVVGPTESAFGIGKTTKKGHSGFGLTIARQAIETLGGVCTLQPSNGQGARFEIRWLR